MPTEHLQKSEASKRSRIKHAAVLLDLWGSSDDEEMGRPTDCCVLVPDTPSPERKLHPMVEHPQSRSSGREAAFDIGESILSQLKTERKRSSQDSTKELRLPQETEESTTFQRVRELSKPAEKRLSRLKPPKAVFKAKEIARHGLRAGSKDSGKKIHTKNFDSSQEAAKKTQSSASIHRQNQFMEEGTVDSTETSFREQHSPAIVLHSINEIERSHQVESVISNKNTLRNKHHDEWFRPTSEAFFSNSDSRADIGWLRTSNPPNRRTEFTTQKFGRLEAEHDSSGSSSDSDSIFSPTFSRRSPPDNRHLLARRLPNKLGAGSSRQKDVEKSFSQLPDVITSVNNILSRDNEKVTARKNNGYMNLLHKMSTEQKDSNTQQQRDSNTQQQFGQNKRFLRVDNPPRTKKARIAPVSWSVSNILDSSSNALERRKTKFEQGGAGSVKQTHNTSKTADKDRRSNNNLGTSDQKIMDFKLFGRTSSDDGDETEEDEDKIEDRKDCQIMLIDSVEDAGEETMNTTMLPADSDSKYTSMSLRASCSQGPSDDSSQKRMANPPGRDEGVILIDITQSADRGAMSGQASPEFQSNFSPCQRTSKSSGSSFMNCKQKAALNKEGPVSPIKIRSNVAWDDDVVHINTIQSTESHDSSEPRSLTFPHSNLTNGMSSKPSFSPVFSGYVPKETTPKKNHSTSSNNPAPQNLTSFGSPRPSLSPVFLPRFSREPTPSSTSVNNPAQRHLLSPDRKHKSTLRNLSTSPYEHHMLVNLTSTDHPDVSAHTLRTRKQRYTDANSSLMLAGQVSSSLLGKAARGPKSDAEELRSRPSPGRTDGFSVSSSFCQIGLNSRLAPDFQDVTHTTPRSGSLNITSLNQDVNEPSSSTATRNFELEIGELGSHQTSNSSGIRSSHIDGRHYEVPGVDQDDRSRVSRHKSRKPRKETRKNKDIAMPPASDVTEVSSMTSEGHRSRHKKERKSSKHGKRRSRERKFSGRPASPDVIELVRQMENDEAMAKQLQEEFDAEANRLAEVSSSDQPILIHDVDGPGCVPVMPELPSLFPGAHNTAFPNQRGTNRWEMRWRDDLVDNNPVNAAMMLEMDRFLVDNMEGHIGQHIHLPQPRQRNRGQRRGRGRGRQNNPHMQPQMATGADYESLWNLAESVGPAISKGLPESSINYLPTFLFTPGQASEEKECSICMGDYETGENMRRLPCFHFYHAVCIDKWLKENRICPVCREEVNFDPVNFH